MQEISNEEIVKIVTGFLLNSPPGEFMEVVTDVRGLLSDEAIINSSAPATFREYNTDQMVEVNSSGGHKVLITKEGEVSPGEYLDPRGNQVIQFDHIRQEVTGTRPAAGNEIDRDVEPYRSAIDAEMEKYCKEHYQTGSVTVYGKKAGGGNTVSICLSSYKFNPNNYWNGRWRSQWTAKFSNNGQVDLNGRIRINVHYYEDGNVQMTTDTPKKTNSPGGNPQATASNIAKTIKKVEQDLHGKLEASYNTLSETTFKALRRILPVTRTKVEWPKIQAYRMGNELGK